MRMCLSLLCLLLLPAAALGTVSVSLHPQASVRTSMVTVGDVASVTGDATGAARAVVLCPAPDAGTTRPLRREQVAWRLAQEGVKEFQVTGPAVVSISRSVRRIMPEELDRAAAEALRQQAGDLGPALELQPTSALQPLLVPEGEIEIRARVTGSTLGSLRSVLVTVLADGRVVRAPTLCYRVRLEAEVPVATTQAMVGTGLTPALWTVQQADIAPLAGRPLRPEEMADRRLTRSVTPGTVLTTDNTEPIPVVVKGSPVVVIVQCGAITLTLEGVARTDGALGQTIEITNPNSRQTFAACVTGPGRVQIKY